MLSFEWIDAATVEEAAALVGASTPTQPVVAKAGGIDLMDLLKEGLLRPVRVVNLASIPGLDGVEAEADGGVRLGALATLAAIADSPAVHERCPALAEAALHAATPQIRRAATIGGNLLQRPRCWYFRNQYFQSEHASVGPNDAAIQGEHQHHAIFDNRRTAMVHASTPATALVAYGAEVHLVSAQGRRRSALLQDFLTAPNAEAAHDAAIGPDEILTHVTVPPTAAGARAAYIKQTQRESYDWPICDAAVLLHMDGANVSRASIVLGWVAPTPRRATASELELVGRAVNPSIVDAAARAAVAGATPLPKNVYKTPILEAVVRRAILAAASA